MGKRRIGGRQIESRREDLRRLLGTEVTLRVRDKSWEGKEVTLKGILEKRGEDGPYAVWGSRAVVPLNYSQINALEGYIVIDLTKSITSNFFNYTGHPTSHVERVA